jgi:hypothetical protein
LFRYSGLLIFSSLVPVARCSCGRVIFTSRLLFATVAAGVENPTAPSRCPWLHTRSAGSHY